MLSRFTYFVNVSCSCASSISSVSLWSRKNEHQLNLSAETLMMLTFLIPKITTRLPVLKIAKNSFNCLSLKPMCTAKNSHTSIRAGWIPLDYQTSLFSIFPVSLKFLHLSSACFVVVAKSRINNVCVSFSLASLLVTIDWRTLGPVSTSLQHNVGTLTTVKDWPRRHGKTSSPQKVGRERERYDSWLLY